MCLLFCAEKTAIEFLKQSPQLLPRHYFFPILAECIFPKRFHPHRDIDHCFKLVLAQSFTDAGGNINLFLSTIRLNSSTPSGIVFM